MAIVAGILALAGGAAIRLPERRIEGMAALPVDLVTGNLSYRWRESPSAPPAGDYAGIAIVR